MVMRLITYVVDFPPLVLLPYLRRIVDLFERLTALISVSQKLKVKQKIINEMK